MTTPELLEYIRTQFSSGTARSVIRDALIKSGWNSGDVDEGIKIVEAENSQASVIYPSPQEFPSMTNNTSLPPNSLSATSEDSHQADKRRKMLALIVALSAILFIGVGAALAYVFVFSQKSPEEIWEKMFIALGEHTHMHGKIAITFRTEGDLPSNFIPTPGLLSLFIPRGIGEVAGATIEEGINELEEVAIAQRGDGTETTKLSPPDEWVLKSPPPEEDTRITSSGVIENRFAYVKTGSPDKPFYAQHGTTSVDLKAQAGALSFSVSGAGEYLLPDDQMFFVRFVKYPDLMPLLNMKAVKLALLNQWIGFEVASLQESVGMSEMKNTTKDHFLDEWRKKLYRSGAIAFEILPEEQVDGVASYHYQIKIDPEKFIEWIESAMKNTAPQNSSMEFGLSESDRRELRKVFESMKTELWIGKKDYLLRKAIVAFGKTDEQNGNANSVSVDIVLTLDPSAPEPQISRPESFFTSEQALERITQQFELSGPGESNGIIVSRLRAAQEDYSDTKKVSDVRIVQLALELYYDANRGYPKALDELVPTYLPNMPKALEGSSGTYLYYTPLDGTGKECRSSRCAGYHIGVSLARGNSTILASDADRTSTNVSGKDESGCGGESGAHCYDLVP